MVNVLALDQQFKTLLDFVITELSQDINYNPTVFTPKGRIQFDYSRFVEKFRILATTSNLPELADFIVCLRPEHILQTYIQSYLKERSKVEDTLQSNSFVFLNEEEQQKFEVILTDIDDFTILVHLLLLDETVKTMGVMDDKTIIRLLLGDVPFSVMKQALKKYNQKNIDEVVDFFISQIIRDTCSYLPHFYLKFPSNHKDKLFTNTKLPLSKFNRKIYDKLQKKVVDVLTSLSHNYSTNTNQVRDRFDTFQAINYLIDVFIENCKEEIPSLLEKTNNFFFDTTVIISLFEIKHLEANVANHYFVKYENSIKRLLPSEDRPDSNKDDSNITPARLRQVLEVLQWSLPDNLKIKHYYCVSNITSAYKISENVLKKTISNQFTLPDFIDYFNILIEDERMRTGFYSDLDTIFLEKAEELLSDKDVDKFKAVLKLHQANIY